MPAKTNLRLVKPTTEKRAVPPRRQPNRELRSREHLIESEVEKLLEAAKDMGMAPGGVLSEGVAVKDLECIMAVRAHFNLPDGRLRRYVTP